MPETVSDKKEVLKPSSKKALHLMLDEDIVNGLERIKATMPFLLDIDSILSMSLRQVIAMLLPLAEQCERQGSFSVEQLPGLKKFFESSVTKLEVFNTGLDKSLKKVEKDMKIKLRGKRCEAR